MYDSVPGSVNILTSCYNDYIMFWCIAFVVRISSKIQYLYSFLSLKYETYACLLDNLDIKRVALNTLFIMQAFNNYISEQ